MICNATCDNCSGRCERSANHPGGNHLCGDHAPRVGPAPRTEADMVADINIHAGYAREGYPGGVL
jgi:hypothetical protein